MAHQPWLLAGQGVMGRSGGRVSAPGLASPGPLCRPCLGDFGGQQDGRKGSHGLLSSPPGPEGAEGPDRRLIRCVVGTKSGPPDVRYQASVSQRAAVLGRSQNPGARKCALGALPPKEPSPPRALNSVDRWKTSKGNLGDSHKGAEHHACHREVRNNPSAPSFAFAYKADPLTT